VGIYILYINWDYGRAIPFLVIFVSNFRFVYAQCMRILVSCKLLTIFFLLSRYAMFGQSVIVDMQVNERERKKNHTLLIFLKRSIKLNNTSRSAFALMVLSIVKWFISVISFLFESTFYRTFLITLLKHLLHRA
jgi:hypothetical protein